MESFDESSSITRKAIGRSAKLGSLYDARKDNFIGAELYIDNIPSEVINPIHPCPNTNYDFNYDETLNSKFDRLNVEGELKLSILMNLVNLEGSGRYLSDKQSSKRVFRSAFVYQSVTCYESFNPLNHKLKNLANDFCHFNGTHVVCGIKYGVNAIFSVEYTVEDSNKTKEIRGKLEALFDKIKLSISGGAKVCLKLFKIICIFN
jgi:hypothetical protein